MLSMTAGHSCGELVLDLGGSAADHAVVRFKMVVDLANSRLIALSWTSRTVVECPYVEKSAYFSSIVVSGYFRWGYEACVDEGRGNGQNDDGEWRGAGRAGHPAAGHKVKG